jgi:cell division transport system permease protein
VGSDSIHFVSARLGTSFLVWLVVGIALALPAGLWILQTNMNEMSAGWEGRPGLSVYFETDVAQVDIDIAVKFLSEQTAIEQVDVTSASDALADFKAYSGLGDALNLLGENPLPASLTARFSQNFSQNIDASTLDGLKQSIQSLVGVAEVVVEKTWLERLNDISTVVSRLGLVLAVLFGLGAILVTASSVRLAIESRLDELRVLKMVGATQGQIRRPFLYFGAIYGFGGGVIAAMLIAVTLLVIEPPLQSLLGSYSQELDLAGFDPVFLLVLLGVGSMLGVIGALVAVRQRLRDLELF